MTIDTKTTFDIPEVENIEHGDDVAQKTADESGSKKDTLFTDGMDDPHLAANLENEDGKMTFRTLMSICFLGLSVTAPLSCSQLMVGSVVNDIATDLNMPAALTNWLLAGWALAATVPVIIVGKISDIFGRRWVMIAGNAWCLLGCIVAGTAQSASQLLAGSIICGFSFGFIILAFTAIPELCPFKYRGLGLAWLELCLFAPWGVAAGILGNLLTLYASWRYIYYIGIIYAGITLIGTAIFYYPPQGPEDMVGKSWQEVVKNFDYIGSALFVTGLPVFILAFSWAGSPGHAWSSVSVIAPLVLGTLTLVAAFIYEIGWADPQYAFMPRRLMLNFGEFSSVCVAGFVSGMVYYAGIQLLPQANLYVFGLDPTTLGFWLLPNGFGQFTGSTIVPGLLLRYTKAPKFWICTAVFLQTLFIGLYAYALPGHPAAWQAFQFFGQGCFDWIITCGVVNISLHVRQSDLGLALGLFGAARNLGGSVGTAVFLTILNGSASSRLATSIPAAAKAAGYDGNDTANLIAAVTRAAVGAPDAFKGLQSTISDVAAAATIQAYRTSYAEAYKIVFYSTIPFGVISFVVCLFIKDAGKYMTDHISVFVKQKKR